MLKSYLITALRILKRQRFYAILNISGLAIGIACFVLIILWVLDELSYDRFHPNYKNLYFVLSVFEYPNGNWYHGNNPLPLGKELKNQFPEIKNTLRYDQQLTTVRYKENLFLEQRFTYADHSIFEMFNFPLITGDTSSWYKDVFSVVLSESMARKYFGYDDPIGKVLKIDGEDNFVVKGVFKDFPSNSSIQCDFIVPIEVFREFGIDMDSWESFSYQTYVEVYNGTDIRRLEEKMKNILSDHFNDDRAFSALQPIEKIHLYKRSGEKEGMKYVIIFTLVAFAILIIACINYTNLTTARAIKRAREISLRKVVGASRNQICVQTFVESALTSFFAMLIAMMLVEIARPVFNNLTGKTITISYLNWGFVLGLLCITLFTGIISGSYPALVISSYRPAKFLKSALANKSSNSYFRIILVVFQFFVTFLLIIGTIVISKQLNYMINKDLGIKTENSIYIACDKLSGHGFDGFKSRLLQNPGINNITRTFQIPSYNKMSVPWEWEGKDPAENHSLNISIADEDYLDVFKLNIIAGRGFSSDFSTDSLKIVLNETAVKLMQIDDPIGKSITAWDENNKIIGVVEDYHFMPLSTEIQPIGLINDPRFYRFLIVGMNCENLKNTIEFIENEYKSYVPESPFSYKFIDEDFDAIYRSERRIAGLTKYFSILSIFIACLGMIGLASFMANNKTKEIGIRKAIGASVSNIVFKLCFSFLKWVLLALLLAVPVSWYLMQSWLNEYVYRMHLSWWIFLLAGLSVIIIAFLTVFVQAYKAARAKPINSLKYE